MQAGAVAGRIRYSPELEADRLATYIVREAGYGPAGGAQALTWKLDSERCPKGALSPTKETDVATW